MKKFFAVVLALMMTLICCSCSSDSVVGKWSFGGSTYTFNEDNSVSISINGAINYDGTYEIDGDKITVKVSGMLGEKTEELTYYLKGDTLTLEGDVTLTGSNMSLEFTKVEK